MQEIPKIMKWILLPGLHGGGELFQPFLETLPETKHIEVISYPNDRMFRFGEYVAFVKNSVLQNEPYLLLAESFSGLIAIKLAAENPANLKALILCATFLRHPVRRFESNIFRLFGKALFKRRPPDWVLKHYLLGQNPPAHLLHTFKTQISKVSPEILHARAKLALETDVSAEFHSLKLPVLWLSASQDKLLAKVIHEPMENMKHASIDSPHLMLQCRPEATIDQILIFMELVNSGMEKRER